MSNTDNLYPIDKSILPTVRFDPSDSCYLPSDNVLRMATCLAMQEVRNAVFIAFLSRWFPDKVVYGRTIFYRWQHTLNLL